METLRILVAEDHPLFRKGMISLLSSVPEFEVVGEVATGEEAVARAAELQVLMDLQMPEVNGIEATRRILQGRAGLEGGPITQHRPENIDPPTRQGDESLSVSLALSSLAIIEGSAITAVAAVIATFLWGPKTSRK